MDIPQGGEEEIRRKVEERLRKASGGSRALDPVASRGKGKAPAGWKHGKLVMTVLKCSNHRIANSYWRAYCEVVAARLIDRPLSEHKKGGFPLLNEELQTMINDHRSGRAPAEKWYCIAEWDTLASGLTPDDRCPVGLEAWFPEYQIDHPPQALVDAIFDMKIQPGQLIDTAVSFCQSAAFYHKYSLTERARKGGKEKNSPSQEEAPLSSRRKPSDKLKRQVLEKVAAMKCMPADSVEASAKELGVGHSTMRNCLPFLVTEGLLQALPDLDRKGSNRHKITAAGRTWLMKD